MKDTWTCYLTFAKPSKMYEVFGVTDSINIYYSLEIYVRACQIHFQIFNIGCCPVNKDSVMFSKLHRKMCFHFLVKIHIPGCEMELF